MKILEEIAYYIHINKQYPIDYDDINRVIKSYNEDYDFTVNTTYLVESLETGRILKKVSGDNKYYFTDTNYLAFFVARKIYAEYSNTGKTIEIEKALNNICFGINSEIILFLSYITKTIALLSILIKKAEDHVFKWETLNLTKNDIDFLSKNRTILLESPSKQEKQVAEREQVHSEEIAQDHKIDIVEIYDYDESETKTFQNQIITSIKYLQILARILPNFTHLLKREPKSKLVQDIYIYPNKILHKVLSSYDLNEVVSELLKEVNKHEENKITRDKMEELVYEMVIILILSLYNMAMSIAADKNTQDNLNNNIPKEEGNITYSIQNLMMDDVLGNVDKFIKKIDTLQKEDISNNILIQNILRIIVKHFLVVNKNIPQPKEQRLKDKFFPKNNSIKNIAIKSQL